MKATLVLTLMLLMSQRLQSAENERSLLLQQANEQRVVTGNLQVDLFGRNKLGNVAIMQDEEHRSMSGDRKSPWLAAGLSLAVPGAGEFYAENYWKAALFLAVDIAAWTLAYSFDKKGDDQTEFFENFADQHWSVRRYAEYARDNLVPASERGNYADLIIPGTDGRPPWQQVNWNTLNRMERAVSLTGEGKYYSHTLAPYSDQQYYEMIGKYKQFNQGWDDSPLSYNYPDPVTPNFNYYSAERGKANDHYTKATTFVTVAIVNHVLSAVDAAWTTGSYNNRLHASMQMKTIPTQSGFASVPVARLEYSF